jgi:hypothetical protein
LQTQKDNLQVRKTILNIFIMKFKNLNKMRVLNKKELSKVKGANSDSDCSSCNAGCLNGGKKSCSPGKRDGGDVIIIIDVEL